MRRTFAVVAVLAMLISTAALFGSNGLSSLVVELKDVHGADFTENTYIAGKLQDLFELLPYSDYPYFTTTGNKSCGNSSCTKCNGANVSRLHPMLKDVGLVDSHNSYSCFAFARYAYYYIYGVPVNGLNYFGNETGTLRRVGRISASGNDRSKITGEYEEFNLSNFKELMAKGTPGDIIQGRTKGGSNHSMVFLKSDDNGVYIIHNNAASGTYGNNRVLISYYTYDRIYSYWNSIITLYRAPQTVYTEAWSQGYDVCEEHKFTDENGDRCVNCYAKYDRIISTDCAGLYKTSGTKTIYQEPYASTTKKGTVNGCVTIVSSEINSIGEKWYRLAGDGYIKDNSLTPVNNSNTLTISMQSYPVGKLKLYSSFSLKGRIYSEKDEITKVSGYLVNSSGKTVQMATFNPDAKSVDIATSDINYKLRFGQLSLGDYKLIISVADGDGCNTIFIAPFKIDPEGEVIVKTDKAAPPAPKLSSKTDKLVVLQHIDGYEYSMDGKNWQASNIFSDLKYDTSYDFYCRWAETATTNASPKSEKLTVKTLKQQVAAKMPTLDGTVGDKTVKLKSVKDHEYSKDGVNWQTSPIFTGLTPGTQYVFFQRDKDVKLSSAGLLVLTSKTVVEAPEAPMIIDFSDTTITIQFNSDCEYAICEAKNISAEIQWQDRNTFKGEFTGLLPAREYYIYCRFVETDQTFASKLSSAAKETTSKTYIEDVPDRPSILAKDSNSITVLPLPGCEYSLDGETFQKSNVFKNLAPCMVYEVVCRYAETATTYAGECSLPLEFEIIPDVITSDIYKIDEENFVITGIESGTTVGLLRASLDQGRYATVRNANGIIGDGTMIATGDEIIINDISGAVARYTLVVRGDIDSNGKSDIADMLIVLAMLSADPHPQDIHFFAADMNADGYINSLDYALLHAKCLGLEEN